MGHVDAPLHSIIDTRSSTVASLIIPSCLHSLESCRSRSHAQILVRTRRIIWAQPNQLTCTSSRLGPPPVVAFIALLAPLALVDLVPLLALLLGGAGWYRLVLLRGRVQSLPTRLPICASKGDPGAYMHEIEFVERLALNSLMRPLLS